MALLPYFYAVSLAAIKSQKSIFPDDDDGGAPPGKCVAGRFYFPKSFPVAAVVVFRLPADAA